MTKRDAKGRFIKGHSGNPNGRAPKTREQRYYEIAISVVPFKQWRRIIKRAAEQAERGDATARRFLAEYFLGKPQQSVDVTSSGEPMNWTTYVLMMDESDNEDSSDEGTAGVSEM